MYCTRFVAFTVDPNLVSLICPTGVTACRSSYTRPTSRTSLAALIIPLSTVSCSTLARHVRLRHALPRLRRLSAPPPRHPLSPHHPHPLSLPTSRECLCQSHPSVCAHRSQIRSLGLLYLWPRCRVSSCPILVTPSTTPVTPPLASLALSSASSRLSTAPSSLHMCSPLLSCTELTLFIILSCYPSANAILPTTWRIAVPQRSSNIHRTRSDRD